MKLRHVGITVTDLTRSLYFYVEQLDFSIALELDESGQHIDRFSALDGIDVRTVKLRGTDGSMIELLKYRSHRCSDENNQTKKIVAIGCSHFALTVPDLASLYEKLASQGVRFLSEPQLSPDGKVKLTFCRDPDGTLIELVQEL